MSDGASSGFIAYLSGVSGASEPALRLLLTILAGYPLALVYRKCVYDKPPAVQHLFSVASGLLLGYWNYGLDILHAVAATTLTYSVLKTLGGSALGVAVVFVYNLAHLLAGYHYAGTDSYDINWTMPQCILVLRLIGVAFDLYDGRRPPETLSTESRKTALPEAPSALELFGHALFPAGFMVGPQFPLRRYRAFVAGEFNEGAEPPASGGAAASRFALGLLYLAVYQALGLLVSDELMYSAEFAEVAFPKRLLLLGAWGRYTLYKYITCWLLTEGACVLFGLAQNGRDDSGALRWDGVENVKLATFENTTEFTHYILSFNTNTNHWIAQYVYKRLKFLGNRHVSQLASLLFLAVWHGFHSGYYVCFLFEFVVVYVERDAKAIVRGNERLTGFFASRPVAVVVNVLLRLYTFVFMGWCLLPFALLTFDRYWAAFNNVHHVGTILFFLWPVVYGPLLRLAFKRGSKTRVD